MKKYEKPEIKEVELELLPILAGSDVPGGGGGGQGGEGGGEIGEDW